MVAAQYFILKMVMLTGINQNPFGIRGLQNAAGGQLGIQFPIPASIPPKGEQGHYEWYIPNTVHNQHHVSTHYSHMKILPAGHESKLMADVMMEGLPAPLDSVNPEEVESPVIETTPVDTNTELEKAVALVAKHNAGKAPAPKMEPPNAKEIPKPATNTVDAPLSPPIVGDSPIYNPGEDDVLPPEYQDNGAPAVGSLSQSSAPAPKADEDSTIKTTRNPIEIKKLKAEITGKLNGRGIAIPKGLTLAKLQALELANP